METLGQYHEIVAVTIARIFLGFLFFFQGYDAVFKIGLIHVQQTFRDGFTHKSVPLFVVDFASWFTSLSELICGTLLILGLFEIVALYLLGINLLIAGIGFGMNNPLWDVRNVFPRLILLLFLRQQPGTSGLSTIYALTFNMKSWEL